MKRLLKTFIPVMLLVVFVFHSNPCWAADEMPDRIDAIIGEPLDQPSGRAMNSIWKEVFKRTGVDVFTVKFYPAKRATMILLSGKADIDLWRVPVLSGLILAYSNSTIFIK